MCNRLGARKFRLRYKETRAQLQAKAEHAKAERGPKGRRLRENYLSHILNEHGFVDDKLYCPNNPTNMGMRRPARLFAQERLSRIWLACYSGVKKPMPNRRRYYAQARVDYDKNRAEFAE